MRTSSWIGLLLVVGGALYLLSQFNVLQVSSGIWSFHALWPLLLVALGLGGLSGFRRGRIPWGSMVVALLGVFLFLHNSGLSPALASMSATGVFWAFVLIFIGLEVFFPKRFRSRGPRISVNIDGKRQDIYWKDTFGEWKGWKPKQAQNRHWIGDVSMGGQPWAMDDLDIWHGIGDVRINLATAHLEDRTYAVAVEGWIGDVRILVPSSLAVAVDVDVNLGDVNVFEHSESGTGRRVHFQDAAYDTETRRVHLNIQLKIGDVQVVRV